MNAEPPTLDARYRTELIEALLAKVREHYVFPDVAAALDADIRRRAAAGEYDALTAGEPFAETLTAHLQATSHDKHLRLFYSAEPQPMRVSHEPTPEEMARFLEWGRLNNFGFARVERLAGNIGYLDLRGFFPPEIEGAGAAAVAAMNLLAHCSALIVDLRQNGGGAPPMVALLTSYLFEGRVHLNNLYWRAGERTEQFWTLAYVPGKRLADTPVYVLTSSHTFSGAEEFSYNLQQLKRATLIGETTGGGAHPGMGLPLDAHFGVGLPTGRAINPISNTNWEGVGVQPDIAVPAEAALTTAHSLALKQVLAQAGDNPTGPLKELAAEARKTLAELEAAPPAPAS